MEAITSRALLLAAVGRATKHAGKTTLYLTPIHTAKTTLMLLSQYPSGSKPWNESCGAVPGSRQMEDPAARYRGQNHPPPTPEAPRNLCSLAG
jgi:hypothetical protein